MIKMDGRDSAECQNWENKGQKWSFLSLIKLEKDKLLNSIVFPNFKETKKT